MMIRFVTTVLLVGFAFSPAMARDYPCPADPGFCYFDVSGDGCFDAGTDTGPIDDQLQAGIYPDLPPGTLAPTGGTVVCPPSVEKLVTSDGFHWTASEILLFGTDIVCPKYHGCSLGGFLGAAHEIYVGGHIVLYHMAPGTSAMSLRAHGDIEIAGDIVFRSDSTDPLLTEIESIDGDIRLGRVSVRSESSIEIVGRNIEMDSTRLWTRRGDVLIYTQGNVQAENLAVFSGRTLSIHAQDIELRGTTRVRARHSYARVRFDAVSLLTIERLVGVAMNFTMAGDEVRLGSSTAKRSRLKTLPAARAFETVPFVHVNGGSLSKVTNVRTHTPWLLIDAADGTGTVRVTHSKLRPDRHTDSGRASIFATTCDLSGTQADVSIFAPFCEPPLSLE